MLKNYLFPGILLLMTWVSPLGGQDLEKAWQSYVVINTDITELKARRAFYTREQLDIKNEVDQLKQSSTWYNAWINKYFLSNHSDRQMVILDSLRHIDQRLSELERRELHSVQNLKHTYELVLRTYDEEKLLPRNQRDASRQVGRWLLGQSQGPSRLPDYSDLVNGAYTNPELRQLVLSDVQQLLQNKITQLDSLLKIKEAEGELARRLADFHQDLGLQMEAEQDVQQRDVSGESEQLNGWFAADASTDLSPLDNAENGRGADGVQSMSINIHRDAVGEFSVGDHAPSDLEYLKLKQQEYQSLLEKINKELNHSP